MLLQIRRLRHVVKMLNHLNISQGDWAPRQILCPRRATAQDGDNSAQAFDICLIDFAFATQDLGERVAASPVNDVGVVSFMLYELGFSSELDETNWPNRDECEV